MTTNDAAVGSFKKALEDNSEVVSSLTSGNVTAASDRFKRKQVEAGVRLILQGMGVDLEDENFKETPQRVARAFRELCAGLYEPEKKVEEIFGKSFQSPYKGMLSVGPINAVGVCPHHLLPIKYKAVIAYIPADKKLGLSKLARAVKLFCASPLMQESVSHTCISKFEEYVKPLGVGLWLRGDHSCMSARGVREHDCATLTLDVRGLFETDPGVKAEFMQQINNLTRGL